MENPIGTPTLISEERHELADVWNDTATPLREDLRLHELVELQVARTPDAIAVVFDGVSSSYRELDDRANRVARALERKGVGPDVLVAVFVERSTELVVALLAVLKAGGAYVPLEPDDPDDRIELMLSEIEPPVVLTQSWLVERLREHGARAVCLDEDSFDRESSRCRAPGAIAADDLAYAIYTSGSTGKPKAVALTHRGVCNRILWQQGVDPLDGRDRFLLQTSVGFDVAVVEVFWPLIAGAGLVIASPGGHKDMSYLKELIAREGVTSLHFAPSVLQIFINQSGLEACPALERVICGGEALPAKLVEQFFRASSAALYNLYGPTEASVAVSSWRCERGGSDRTVPIGRPIANTQMHILDSTGAIAPIGITGELYLGGVGLARGYVKRPELTAEKFATGPLGRLYRTGDLARRRPDGAIEYVGRIDDQVKIHGVRMELGEIEAAVRNHPDVREAVVVVREDTPGDRRLVAYFVPENGPPLTVSELRSSLSERLPRSMVPSTFVSLEALPLNRNGKIDRGALPAPDHARPELDEGFIAPRTPVERALATIWGELLKLDRVGITDDFFDLGGNSLLVVDLMHRIERDFHLTLPRAMILVAPTIARVARVIERGDQDEGSLVTIRRASAGESLYLVHSGDGGLLCYRQLVARLDDIGVHGFQMPALEGSGEPGTTVEDLARRYVAQLCVFQTEGPYNLAGHSLGGFIALEMARLLRARGKTVGLLALLDSNVLVSLSRSRTRRHRRQHIWWRLKVHAKRIFGTTPAVGLWHCVAEARRLLRRVALRARGGSPRAEARTWTLQDACWLASHRHLPAPYTGHVVLFNTPDVEESAWEREPLMGWQGILTDTDVQCLPGGHVSMLTEPHVQTLARGIRQSLARSSAEL